MIMTSQVPVPGAHIYSQWTWCSLFKNCLSFIVITIIIFVAGIKLTFPLFPVWRGSGRVGIRQTERAYLRLPWVNCLQSSVSWTLFEYFHHMYFFFTPLHSTTTTPSATNEFISNSLQLFSLRLNWGVIKWSDGISGPAGQKHQKLVGKGWKRTWVRRHWGRRFGINAGTLSSVRRPFCCCHYYLDKWDNWAECRCSAGLLSLAGSSAPPGVTTRRPWARNATIRRGDLEERANETNRFVHLRFLLFYSFCI